MTAILYTKPGAVVRLTVPAKHDWGKVGDFMAGKLFPGFDPAKPDPVFDQSMKNLAKRAEEKKEVARKERQDKRVEQRGLLE